MLRPMPRSVPVGVRQVPGGHMRRGKALGHICYGVAGRTGPPAAPATLQDADRRARGGRLNGAASINATGLKRLDLVDKARRSELIRRFPERAAPDEVGVRKSCYDQSAVVVGCACNLLNCLFIDSTHLAYTVGFSRASSR